MTKHLPSYFISYEYHDTMDFKKILKTDSFITTDGLLYLSPNDMRILSEEIQKQQYRTVTKYLNVNRLDKNTNST